MAGAYDRRRQDLGNIVSLEHVNVCVPDQRAATAFYAAGLGLTRDPYLMVGNENMWVNVGAQQFHLPTSRPQVLRGVVGLVLQHFSALPAQLDAVRDELAGTRFAWAVEADHIAVTSPWGNRLRCHAPGPWGDLTLGLVYVDFPVKPGVADGIARFYRSVMGAPATLTREASGPVARIVVGQRQELIFRETGAQIEPYDGHHIAIYVANFSGPHAWLAERGLITEESGEHQYRFFVIADPETGAPLFEIEHEVRSLTHPMAFRPLVNRNPAQRQPSYARGRDAFVPEAG